MKCPKCGYNSFEYLDTCKKCSADLTSFKASNNIIPLIIPLSRTVAPTPSSEPSFVPPAAAFEDTHDNFLTDNPAIISSAGTSAAAGGGNDPVFGEFSFGDDLQAGLFRDLEAARDAHIEGGKVRANAGVVSHTDRTVVGGVPVAIHVSARQ